MVRTGEDVQRWRRRTKQRLVNHLGGKCVRCEWTGNNAGFDFHHTGGKDFGISGAMTHPKKYELLLAEVEKCELLCARCHRLEHAGPSYDEERDGPLEQPPPQEFWCSDCGKKISFGSVRCNKCRGANKMLDIWPSDIQEVLEDVRVLGFSGTGRKYGVSDNAVRKHLSRN